MSLKSSCFRAQNMHHSLIVVTWRTNANRIQPSTSLRVRRPGGPGVGQDDLSNVLNSQASIGASASKETSLARPICWAHGPTFGPDMRSGHRKKSTAKPSFRTKNVSIASNKLQIQHDLTYYLVIFDLYPSRF